MITVVSTQHKSPITLTVFQGKPQVSPALQMANTGTTAWNLLLWLCRTSTALQEAQHRRSGPVGRKVWRPEVHGVRVWFREPTWIVLAIYLFLTQPRTVEPMFTECTRCMSLVCFKKAKWFKTNPQWEPKGGWGGVVRKLISKHTGSAQKRLCRYYVACTKRAQVSKNLILAPFISSSHF